MSRFVLRRSWGPAKLWATATRGGGSRPAPRVRRQTLIPTTNPNEPNPHSTLQNREPQIDECRVFYLKSILSKLFTSFHLFKFYLFIYRPTGATFFTDSDGIHLSPIRIMFIFTVRSIESVIFKQ